MQIYLKRWSTYKHHFVTRRNRYLFEQAKKGKLKLLIMMRPFFPDKKSKYWNFLIRSARSRFSRIHRQACEDIVYRALLSQSIRQRKHIHAPSMNRALTGSEAMQQSRLEQGILREQASRVVDAEWESTFKRTSLRVLRDLNRQNPSYLCCLRD